MEAREFETVQLQLAAELRRLRKEAGLTGVEVGKRSSISQSKLSKIERCRLTPSVEDVRGIAKATGASQPIADELLAMVRMLEAPTHWVLTPSGPVNRQAYCMQAESLATTYKYCDVHINGLLQTPDYMREILKRLVYSTPDNEVEEFVVARTRRQAILVDQSRSFQFLLLENALATPLAPHDVMSEQMEQVSRIAERPNVEIGIVAFGTVMPSLFEGTYQILDDRFVIQEGMTTDVEVTDSRAVGRFARHFHDAWEVAVKGEQALDLARKHLYKRSVDLRHAIGSEDLFQ